MRISGGEFKGRQLKTVRDNSPAGYRPATQKVRLALMSMLEARGLDWETSRVLDCFAGSGSLGLEALSRGAAFVCFVERDPAAARLIRENALLFDLPPGRWQVLGKELLAVLRRGPAALSARPAACFATTPATFDLAFIDPPYGANLLVPAVAGLLDAGWLAPGAWIVAEVESRLDLEPTALDHRLQPRQDRQYGQTRIVIWEKQENSPSTPEPSTP